MQALLKWLAGCFAVVANEFAKERRARDGKLRLDQDLAAFVVDRLRAAWSPEQIAGHPRCRSSASRLCHETIDRHVYGPDGAATNSSACCRPTAKASSPLRPQAAQSLRATIAAHPATIAQRTDFGR